MSEQNEQTSGTQQPQETAQAKTPTAATGAQVPPAAPPQVPPRPQVPPQAAPQPQVPPQVQMPPQAAQMPPPGAYYQMAQPYAGMQPPPMGGYYQMPPQQQPPHVPPHRSSAPVVCPYAGKRSHGWIWGLVVALIIIFVVLPILGLLALGAIGAMFSSFVDDQIGDVSNSLGGTEIVAKGDLTRRVLVKGEGKREIAIIDVKGVILRGRGTTGVVSSGDLCKILKELKKNKDVVAIVLDMDSPGGEIVATDEIHQAMQDCRASGKKIVTCMHSLGASGGYYLAAGGDWIVANRMTMTGSIGVIMSSYNIQGLAEKVGIKPVVIKSGAMKDMLSPMRDLSESEREYLQKHIDESFGEFAKIVAAGRPAYADEQAVRKAEFADGRVVSGARAMELGLIDELGGMEDALKKARALGNVEKPTIARYGVRNRFWDSILEMRSSENPLMKAAAVHLKPGQLYYIAPTALGL
ncbi:MAG: signal peptide peptidase SppA [Lentisphaeria bacterium]|nr:signal peptide peptidase SppA [Lentisphaeria bacterium]